MDIRLLFRFQITIASSLLLFSGAANAQPDTIVLVDYTQMMVKATPDGKIIPITDLKKEDNLGFFLERSAKGQIRICNDHPISLWVDGRLADKFEGCKYFETDELLKKNTNDTLFITVHSKFNFGRLVCQRIDFRAFRIVRENTRLARNIQSDHQDFLSVGLIIIIFIIGWTFGNNSSRVSYLTRRMLSMKVSSYEFVNTSFFSQNNLQISVLISLLIGLLLENHELALRQDVERFHILILNWLGTSVFIFTLIVFKWLFATAIAQLFRLKKISDYQLFDFQNIILCSFVLMGFLHFVGFTLYSPLQNFFQANLKIILMLIIWMFFGWFGLKFINNFRHKKLQIISYLCATEIIPTIWFYLQIRE